MTNLASHDGGRLLGEQSPAIHHSREIQVAKIHERAHGYQVLAPKMNQSLWFHFVVDSMVIGSFLQFVLSSSSGKT
jgi:hypothetical protein